MPRRRPRSSSEPARRIALHPRASPRHLERGRGHVVNVASIAGRIGSRNHAVYRASKFALAGLSEASCTSSPGRASGDARESRHRRDVRSSSHPSSRASATARRRANRRPRSSPRRSCARCAADESRYDFPRTTRSAPMLKTVAPALVSPSHAALRVSGERIEPAVYGQAPARVVDSSRRGTGFKLRPASRGIGPSCEPDEARGSEQRRRKRSYAEQRSDRSNEDMATQLTQSRVVPFVRWSQSS